MTEIIFNAHTSSCISSSWKHDRICSEIEGLEIHFSVSIGLISALTTVNSKHFCYLEFFFAFLYLS